MCYALLLSVLLTAAPNGTVSGPASKQVQTPVPSEVARWLKDLDSNRFEVRSAAAERLEEMIEKPELANTLAAEFQRVLLRPDVSFEVRWHVKNWCRRLPNVPAEAVPDASSKDLDGLVQQLDSDSYAVRTGAARRLEWLLGNQKLVVPLLVRLKKRLSEGQVGSDVHHPLVVAWQRTRGAWLLSDAPSREELPVVSDEQIGQLLDDLCRASATKSSNGVHPSDAAERELLDLLARDEYVAKVKQGLSERLAHVGHGAAATRLNTLLDWTKPELVAEYWEDCHQENEQHLLVGVPTLSPFAIRPSHFDRVDDRTAHCVSGNSLAPGDYPVGIAFPHPKREGAVFHLVNLPTPRRRMAYTYQVQTDEAKRLAAITRRTLDEVLADRRVMSESELLMLTSLDPVEVSRFAGKYFLLVEDSSLVETGPPRLGGRPSRFGLFSVWLAMRGTKDVMPGLLDAIAKDVFLPPTSRAQYRLHLVAALAIAARDPWPTVDTWLAQQIGQTERLVEGQASAAELGATAAAVLLKRHQQKPSDFGLQPAVDPLLNHLKVSGCRFNDEAARQRVQKWWDEQKGKEKVP